MAVRIQLHFALLIAVDFSPYALLYTLKLPGFVLISAPLGYPWMSDVYIPLNNPVHDALASLMSPASLYV